MSFFLPTSRTFTVDDFNRDPTMFIRVLNKFSEDTANAVNVRTIGNYLNQAIPCGNTFFSIVKPSTNNVSRIVLEFNSLASGLNTLPINVTFPSNVVISALYAMAQNGSIAIPIPYINITNIADSISIYVNLSTNSAIIQTSTSNWTAFYGFVVVEYF